jgi:hypothetical protein
MSQGQREPGPTLPELADQLGVPLLDVVRAAMSLGVRRTATEPLTAEEGRMVMDLVRLDAGESPTKGHS